MPTLGLGAASRAVDFALKNGYKHIDTTAAYDNDADVGAGIEASAVPCEFFFLTTELKDNDYRRVEEALEFSLKALKADYLDFWLMHWPAPMVQDLSGPDHSIDWLD